MKIKIMSIFSFILTSILVNGSVFFAQATTTSAELTNSTVEKQNPVLLSLVFLMFIAGVFATFYLVRSNLKKLDQQNDEKNK